VEGLLREESRHSGLARMGRGRCQKLQCRVDVVRKDQRTIWLSERSQSFNHGSLGCSFSAGLSFPIWAALDLSGCW